MRHLIIDCFYTVILEIFYVGAFEDCLWPQIYGKKGIIFCDEYNKYYYGMPVPIMKHHLPTDKGNYHNFKLIS